MPEGHNRSHCKDLECDCHMVEGNDWPAMLDSPWLCIPMIIVVIVVSPLLLIHHACESWKKLIG